MRLTKEAEESIRLAVRKGFSVSKVDLINMLDEIDALRAEITPFVQPVDDPVCHCRVCEGD